MQGPGCCVLSKTRPTVQETAGIPIWTPSDSCSACAASARRSLFNPRSKHLHCAKVRGWGLFAIGVIHIVFFAEGPREMQHNQVSCFVVREPGSRASAVLSKMHRSDLHPNTKIREGEKIQDVQRADFLGPLQVIRSESPQDSELLSNPAGTTELFINQERPSTSATSSRPSRVTSVLCVHALWVLFFSSTFYSSHLAAYVGEKSRISMNLKWIDLKISKISELSFSKHDITDFEKNKFCQS